MVAVQIPFVNRLQTKPKKTYHTILKYKNEIIFVSQFCFDRNVFSPLSR